MDLIELKLIAFETDFPMSLNFRVSHNYASAIYNHNTKNNLAKLQISLFSFKDKTNIKIPCNTKQCLSPNWNFDDTKIIFSSNEEKTITEFDLKTKKHLNVYITTNNLFVGSPSYTLNNNIIFTEIDKSENYISSNIYRYNRKEKKITKVYKIKEFVPSVINLNNENIVLFPIIDNKRNKFLILDTKNSVEHYIAIPKPYIQDTVSWRL